MGKFPLQTLLAALLLLALAFSVHDPSDAEAQNKARASLQPSCESIFNQKLDKLGSVAGPSLNCPFRLAKK